MMEVPVFLAVDHKGEISLHKAHADALAFFRAGNPVFPAAIAVFRSRQRAGEDQLASRIASARINLFERSDLRGGQAFVGIVSFAKEHGGIEVALSGIV